jgi:hypothetical protein
MKRSCLSIYLLPVPVVLLLKKQEIYEILIILFYEKNIVVLLFLRDMPTAGLKPGNVTKLGKGVLKLFITLLVKSSLVTKLWSWFWKYHWWAPASKI